MKSIKETFLSRSQWVNNRASAVFPCYINDKNDQVITKIIGKVKLVNDISLQLMVIRLLK